MNELRRVAAAKNYKLPGLKNLYNAHARKPLPVTMPIQGPLKRTRCAHNITIPYYRNFALQVLLYCHSLSSKRDATLPRAEA
jgi:hypothetical protein